MGILLWPLSVESNQGLKRGHFEEAGICYVHMIYYIIFIILLYMILFDIFIFLRATKYAFFLYYIL